MQAGDGGRRERGGPPGGPAGESALARDLANYLADKAAQLRDILEASHDMISLNRVDSTFVYVSPACRDILGYAPEELIGRRALDLLSPEDRDVAGPAREQMLAGLPVVVEFRVIRSDGEPVWVEATARPPRPGRDTVAVVTRDVTERHEMQELLVTAALHDPVTGLPNRRLFDEHLHAELARTARRDTGLAVLFIDVDNFKPLNDRLGHLAGDRVLREVGERISRHVRAGDVAARYGGDEFVVACADLHSSEEPHLTADRIRAEIALPIQVNDHVETVSASVGVAMWRPGMTPEEVVHAADQAMYDTKHRIIELPEARTATDIAEPGDRPSGRR